MIAKRILSCIKGKQKGDVFVMVAASMAAVMFCGAAVIDLGSLYAHKSELQNAADAAALAGARAMADNEETIDEHPEADNIAETYVERNLGEGYNTARISYQAKEGENVIYYRIKLEDKCPTYFLRYFDEDLTVSVDAVASIATAEENISENIFGKDLFIFRKNLYIQDVLPNRDDTAKPTVTFDGTIAFTNGTGTYDDSYHYRDCNYAYDINDYDKERLGIKGFFTDKARDCSSKEALNNNLYTKEIYEQFDMDELGRETRKMLGLPDYDAVNEFEQYSKAFDKIGNEANNLTQDHLKNNLSMTADNQGNGNVSLKISENIPGEKDKPAYLYIDKNWPQDVTINITHDVTNRPLIIVYEGSKKLHLNMDNIRFRGVIYAPNVPPDDKESGLHVNAHNTTFKGSIIANSITIKTNNASFEYESFTASGTDGKGNSSGNKASPLSKISLVNPKSISWD